MQIECGSSHNEVDHTGAEGWGVVQLSWGLVHEL